jgi:hypothetical protein
MRNSIIFVLLISFAFAQNQLRRYDVPIYMDYSHFGYEDTLKAPQNLARQMMVFDFGQATGEVFFQQAQFGMAITDKYYSNSWVWVKTTKAKFVFNLNGEIFCYQRLTNGAEKLITTIKLPPDKMDNFWDFQYAPGCVTFKSGNNFRFRINGDAILMIQNFTGGTISAVYNLNFYPGYVGRQEDWKESGHSDLILNNYGGFGVYLMAHQPAVNQTPSGKPRYIYQVPDNQVFWTAICPPKDFDWNMGKKRIIFKWGQADLDSYPSDSRWYKDWWYFPYLAYREMDFWIDHYPPLPVDSFSAFSVDIFALTGDVNLWGDSTPENCWHTRYEPQNNSVHQPHWDFFEDSTLHNAHSRNKEVVFYTSPSQYYRGSHYYNGSPYYAGDPNLPLVLYYPPPPPPTPDWPPGNPEGENLFAFLAAVDSMVNRTSPAGDMADGLYMDGLYFNNIPQAYRLLRNVRYLLDSHKPNRKIILHSAPLPGGDAYLPQTDAYADFVYRGEGGYRFHPGCYWDAKYGRYFIGTYNTSNSVGIFLWECAYGTIPPYTKDLVENKILKEYNLRLPVRAPNAEDLSWSGVGPQLRDTLLHLGSNYTYFDVVDSLDRIFDPTIAWRIKEIQYENEFKVLSFDTDVGVFRDGLFLLDTNRDAAADIERRYGVPADVPVTGDWNGDAVTDLGVYRNNNGVMEFYLESAPRAYPYGLVGDIPIAGDWDGNGVWDYGVRRGGDFFLDINRDQNPDISFPFGYATDIPVSGDWDGDGVTNVGIYRPGARKFYLDTDWQWYNGAEIITPSYDPSYASQTPVSGDWDGDGDWDVGFRKDNVFYFDNNRDGVIDREQAYGYSSDIPVTGNWDARGVLPSVMVSLLNPQGKEKIEAGSVYPITWIAKSDTGIGLQSLYYSTDKGETWENIIIEQHLDSIIPYYYRYNWTVPAHPSDSCLIKVAAKDIANNTGTEKNVVPFSICWLTSSDSSATAGNGEKIIFDQGIAHAVFTSGDSIFYSYSSDEGLTWERKQLIDLGAYPALGIDGMHRVHLVYKKGHDLFYKRLPGPGNPALIYTTSNDLQAPSFFVAGNRGHLAFEEREGTAADAVSHLMYAYFNFDSTGNLITKKVLSDHNGFLMNPHIGVSRGHEPHMVYERADTVYYLRAEEENWHDPAKIGIGRNPKISIDGEVIDVVWEGGGEIYHRKKWLYGAFGPIENLSNTPNSISKNPIMIASDIALWLEEPAGLPDSKFNLMLSSWQRNRWSNPAIIVQNNELAYSPKACLNGNNIYTSYVLGNQSRYEIKTVNSAITLPRKYSETKYATSSNNAHRLVMDNSGRRHAFYRTGDYVYYNYDNVDRIFAEGTYPAAVYKADVIHTVWLSGSALPPHNLWYRKGIAETWEEPKIIWSQPGAANYRQLPPSFAVSQDTGYVAIEEELTTGPTLTWKLNLIKFPLIQPENITIIKIDSVQIPTPPPPQEDEPYSPSIVLDNLNHPHIVWSDKFGRIMYTYWDGFGFTPKTDLTAGYIGNLDAKRPCLDIYKNRLSVVFDLFNDIYYAYRRLPARPSPGFSWSVPINLSRSSDSSTAGIILNGSQVFYQEKETDKWQVYHTCFNGLTWSTPENINQSRENSYYVQGIMPDPDPYAATPIYLIWAQQNQGKYDIVDRQINGLVPNWQSGEITQNTAWPGNVFITGDLTINNNAILNIQPGSRIYFEFPDDQVNGADLQKTELIINGSLNASGNQFDSIKFIPYIDTLGWWGVSLGTNSHGNFDYCHIGKADSGITYKNCTGYIKNSLLDSNRYALRIINSNNVTVKNCVIRDNGEVGIDCEGSKVAIDSNLIQKNGAVGITMLNEFMKNWKNKFSSPVKDKNNPLFARFSVNSGSQQGTRDSLPFSCTGINIRKSQCKITNNQIIDNFRGIYTSDWIVGKVTNNLFDANLFHGFDFYGDSFDIAITSNTFSNNGNYDWPVTELAGIYQGWQCYKPGTSIRIAGNKFNNNKVGLSLVKYYQQNSNPITTYIDGNTLTMNEVGVHACADQSANLEAVLTRNIIHANHEYQVHHQNSASPLLNLGNLDNASKLDDGGNRIYGNSQYDMRNDSPFDLMAQGNFWNLKDSASIDRRIYDKDENPACGLVNFKYYSTWGDIPLGTVWDGIVNVGGDITIPNRSLLIIRPGTEVRFTAGMDASQGGIDPSKAEMLVYGNIEVSTKKGNNWKSINTDFSSRGRCPPALPVYFTSDAYEPQPGDWYGIRYMNKNPREISGYVINYATRGLDMPLTMVLELNNSRINYASEYGLYFIGNSMEAKSCSLTNNRIGVKIITKRLEIKDSYMDSNNVGLFLESNVGELKNNQVINNDTGLIIGSMTGEIEENRLENNGIGIYLTASRINTPGYDFSDQGNIIDGGKILRIGRDNEFRQNLLYHIFNNTANFIDATLNYWYPAAAESIAYYVYDYYDNPALGIVQFLPTAGGISGGAQGAEGFFEKIAVDFGPNPAPGISLRYTLNDRQKVVISIYDVTGRLVDYEEKMQKSGDNHYRSKDLSNGVYFVRFCVPGTGEINRKVIVLK